jgi:hypothetical protein
MGVLVSVAGPATAPVQLRIGMRVPGLLDAGDLGLQQERDGQAHQHQ